MTAVLDKIEIIEYEDKYEQQVKNLFIQLQKYYVDLDDDKIRVLSDRYIEEYFDFIRDFVLNNREGKILISVKNGKVLGAIIGLVEENTKDDQLRTTCPKMGKISKLVVDENCRKCGVGKVLINEMERYLKSIDCEYINIDVFGYNTNALSFYDKNGYNIRMHNMIKKI